MPIMRSFVTVLSAVALLGCPAAEGPQGPIGPQGAVGPAGPQGAPGPAGPQGAGPPGPPGAMGAPGSTGPAGPQGIEGPAGMVLVLDGGVVTGPPGSSVVVTAIAPGATCAMGGIRVTQVSDGGFSSVCNGATGPGGATGPAGPAGPTGPAAALTATSLPTMSPQCQTGGVLVGLPDGGSLSVCNGATGAPGLAGATGAPGAPGGIGPAGATGPTGPPGSPGPALFLDGGLAFVNDQPSFAGFTTMTYTGSIGGHIGANQKCNAEFAGSVFCTVSDFDRSNYVAPPPASGAWIDTDRQASGQRTQNSCTSTSASWTLGTVNDTGTNLNALGVFSGQLACTQVKPLACCRVPSPVVFRGYTAATFNGAIGGHVGANAKCAAEFPGSFFCTVSDFDKANPMALPPAAGAWIDTNRGTTGTRTQNSCTSASASWNLGTTLDTGTNLSAAGVFAGQLACNQVKPLACCQYR